MQLLNRVRDVALWLELPLVPYTVNANIDGSVETAGICNKSPLRMGLLNYFVMMLPIYTLIFVDRFII